MNNIKNISDKEILDSFIRYVTTSTIGMLMISLYILFDTIFIGQRFGQVGLAALNISIPIYNLLFGVGILIGTGSAIIISINKGSKEMLAANRAFEHSIILGTIFGILFSVLGFIFLEDLMVILGAGPSNRVMVKEYLSIIIPFSWSFIMVYNLAAIVRNDNGPKRAMLAMGLGGITNVIFDYVLIFPLNMGMRGAAIATVMSSLVSLLILSCHFLKGYSNFNIKSYNLNKDLSIRIFKTGFSSFIVELSSGLIIYFFNIELIKTLGYIGVSAYSIIANLALMIIAIFNGISQGIQPLISYNFGAGRFDDVDRVRKQGTTLSFVLGFLFLSLGILFPEFLISLFTSEAGEIVNLTKFGLQIYFLSFPIAGINIVLNGYLQSIEMSKYAAYVSMIRGIFLNLIGLKLLSFYFGSLGIWITTPITEIITLIVIIIILLQLNKSTVNKAMELDNVSL